MLSQRDVQILGNIMAEVLKNTRTTKFLLPPPPPYRVDLTERVLESRPIQNEFLDTFKTNNSAPLVATGIIVVVGVLMLVIGNVTFSVIASLLTPGGAVVLLRRLQPKTNEDMKAVRSVDQLVPVNKTLQVEVGSQDYPERRVNRRDLKPVPKDVVSQVDLGPDPRHFVISLALTGVLGVIAAICFGLGSVVGFVLFWGGGIGSAFAYLPLRRKMRLTEQKTETVTEWQEVSDTVLIHVDDRYAPKYEDRLVPSSETVVSIGKVCLDFYGVPFKDFVLMVDAQNMLPPFSFDFPSVRCGDEARKILEDLNSALSMVPAILSGDKLSVMTSDETSFVDGATFRGEEITLRCQTDKIADVYRDIYFDHLSPSLVHPNDPLVSLLEQDAESVGHDPTHYPEVAKLIELDSQARRQQLEATGERFIQTWEPGQHALDYARITSLDTIVASLLDQMARSAVITSFNWYCPDCEREKMLDIIHRDYSIAEGKENPAVYFSKNSRCYAFYNENTHSWGWRCPTCEQIIQQPIPVHKILDDVLYPSFDRLMEENKIHRFALDNKIKEQEVEYSNRRDREREDRYHEQAQEGSRTQSELEFLQADLDAHVDAMDSFKQLLADYQQEQARSLLMNLDVHKTLREQTRLETDKAIQQMHEDGESRLAEYASRVDKKSRSKRVEQEMRDGIQSAICLGVWRNVENTEYIKRDTTRIANASEKSASHLETIEQQSGRIAAATEKSAEHLENIEQTSERTAKATEQSSEHLEKIERHTQFAAHDIRFGNDLTVARAMESPEKVRRLMKRRRSKIGSNYSR